MDLNYIVNSSDPELREWNYNLNYEDIIHDSPGLQKNSAFNECLQQIFAAGIGSAEGVYFEPHTLPKVCSNCAQLTSHQIFHSIPDTYPGAKLGLKDKITPSYFFDPATRQYNAGVFNQLQEFINKLQQPVMLTKYGLNIHLVCKLEKKKNANFLVMSIKDNDSNDKFEIEISGNQGFYYPARQDILYISGNNEKKVFFETYQGSDKNVHGKRIILCKLLGDLMHAVFSNDSNIVFTNDSYLRDRCIKNEVGSVCREYIKVKVDKSAVGSTSSKKVVKSSKKPAKKPAASKKSVEQVSVYNYFPISAHRSASVGGSASHKQSGGNAVDVFQNESNKQNLLHYTDLYVAKLNRFLSGSTVQVMVHNTLYDCPATATDYVRALSAYLSGEEYKNQVIQLNVGLPVDEFNREIMAWFPQDILYHVSEMKTRLQPDSAAADYFSPTEIKRVFPHNQAISEDINAFPGGVSFMDFAVAGLQIAPVVNTERTLFDFLDRLRDAIEKLLRESEITSNEVVYNPGSENRVMMQNLFQQITQNKDVIVGPDGRLSEEVVSLINMAIDMSIIDENDVLLEFLSIICKGDEIKSATVYATLLPLTNFDGYNIYDYYLLSKFVEKMDQGVYISYLDFHQFLLDNIAVEEDVDEEPAAAEADNKLTALGLPVPKNPGNVEWSTNPIRYVPVGYEQVSRVSSDGTIMYKLNPVKVGVHTIQNAEAAENSEPNHIFQFSRVGGANKTKKRRLENKKLKNKQSQKHKRHTERIRLKRKHTTRRKKQNKHKN